VSPVRSAIAADLDAIETIINAAAQKYRGVIPDDCWHEPYMPRAELEAEIARGVSFSVYESERRILGVMGLQEVRDVTLIRHAYVIPACQGQGIGTALMRSLVPNARSPLLVGTWSAARWAIGFYERHGFRLVPQNDKDRLLNTYWNISPRQCETSVVLVQEIKPALG
jgi:N-acetylglutamate synthase-like GNAT family acetyltransferase